MLKIPSCFRTFESFSFSNVVQEFISSIVDLIKQEVLYRGNPHVNKNSGITTYFIFRTWLSSVKVFLQCPPGILKFQDLRRQGYKSVRYDSTVSGESI
jgi:hypothetical protein